MINWVKYFWGVRLDEDLEMNIGFGNGRLLEILSNFDGLWDWKLNWGGI